MAKMNDGITVAIENEVKDNEEPRVSVFIPLPPDVDTGIKIDPYEHVTINGEKPVYIKKGERVEVTVPVFLQLRNKYPNI